MIGFCIRNYRDMGFEVFAGIAEVVTSRVSDAVEGASERLHGFMGGGDYGAGDHSSRRSKSGSRGRTTKEPTEVKVVDGDRMAKRKTSGGKDEKDVDNPFEDEDDYSTSSYTDGRVTDRDYGGSREIDSQINKGREIADKEKQDGTDGNSARNIEPKQ